MGTINSEDFGRDMNEALHKLETDENITLTKDQKLLLAERGSLEQTLSIIVNSPIRVEIVKQARDAQNHHVITREAWLKDITGRRLVHATTIYNLEWLPEDDPDLYKEVEEELLIGRMGIGSVIMKHQLATYRRIKKIGYDREKRNLFRVYQIVVDRDAVFEIHEEFSRDSFL